MKRENVEAIFRLSPVQQGMLFHTLAAPSTGAYFDQFVVPLQDLDHEVFRRVWERLVAHHAALRTAFLWQGLEEPVQIVYKNVELPFSVEDLRGLPAAEQEARIAEHGAAERRAGFDLVRAPLMKLRVFRLGDADRLVWSYHHAILDGWSSGLLLRQLVQLYPAAARGVEAPLEPGRPFQDYVRWLARQNGSAAESYWRETLAGFDAPTWVGLDHGTPGAPGGEGFGRRSVVLCAAESAALQDAAKRFRVSVHTLVEAAWTLTLARFSDRWDVVFGVTFAGRPAELPGVGNMAGCFVNTLPVRVRVDPAARVGDWLGELHRARTALVRHQHSSLVEIRAWSDMPGDLPLFESLVVSDSFIERRNYESFQRTNYPLALSALTSRDDLRLHLGFDRERFGDAEAGRLLRFTADTLYALADGKPRPVSALLELPAAERHLVCVEWNGAPVAWAADAPLHRLFERRAGKTPDTIAVVCGEEALTYRELDRRANALARRLGELGVGADDLVGLYAERSNELVVAILGILKAGAAYVPLDPAYPRERLAFILGDAHVAALVSQEALAQDLPETAGPVVFLDGAGSDERRPDGGTPDSLAYVIYTSGSTGKPKGSPIAHKNVVRLFAATEDAFGFGPGDVWTLFHSCAFDFSVWELWGALLYGGRLVVVPYWVSRSPEDFLELLRRERVTFLNQTPSAFRQLAEAEAESGGGELALREVVFGGEALDVESLRPWIKRHPERPRLVNMYGITETTVHVTYRPLRPADLKAGGSRSPLGRAIPDLSLRLLDRHGRPVPLGVPGELCVGGAGPGRGYLGRPGLTAERFVPDPWSRVGGGRLYRSGDLASYLAGGELEYLGRIDHQVKVRGFRIELGEIEQVLAEQPGVGQAVVLAHDTGRGEDQLVAWLAVGDGEAPPEAALRQALRRKLPEYMVPAFFEVVEALPLTDHGKVDRAALGRKALAKQAGPGHGWTSPTEEVLAGIWNDVLGAAPESPSASFFELGGHSLLATRVAARIRQAFGVDVPLERLFRLPVLAELAREVEGRAAGTAAMPPIAPRTAAEDADLPLSFAQERLWLIDQLQPQSAMYNVPVGLDVLGELSVPALRACLATIAERHEPLRTRFRNAGGRPRQVVEPPSPVAVPVVDLRSLPEERRADLLRRLAAGEAARPFDLATGPLLRVVLLRHDEDRHRLLMTLHHAVTDGASMGILLRELTTLYDARHRGAPARLPELPVQYADFALWQRRWLEGGELERQLAYWRERLAGLHDVLELPADRPRSALVVSRGAAVPSAWPRPLQEGLEALSRSRSATLFMTLLAAFQTLLGRLSGRRDLTVGSPVANRRRLETEGLIGFFVNTLVLRADLRGEPSFVDLLERTRRFTLDAYGRQDVPFEALVAELAPERSLHHTPLFQVMLSLEDDVAATWPAGDLELRPLLRSSGTAKFDLNVQVRNGAAGLSGAWEYRAELFDAVTVRRFARALRVLLEGVVEDPERTLSALPLLTGAELHQLTAEGLPDDAPDGPRSPPRGPCLHQLFAEQVRRRGDAVAVTCGATSLTYAELDRRARRLARHLHALGVGPESRVGLSAERDAELVVGLLAVVLAGGAYVPLDPSYPAARLAYLVEDAGVEVLLAGSGVEAPAFDGPVLALDDDGEAPEAELPDVDPDHPAYVIYTSGSTGRPKGVVVTHRHVARLLASTDAWFGFGPDDVWTLFHSFAFDFSVWELWGALAYGGRLVVVPYWVSRSPGDFCHLLAEEGVTVLNQTPSAFRQLIAAEAETDGAAAAKLRYVIFGGEALPVESLAPWVERHGDGTDRDGPALVNMYGITETTVHVTYRPVTARDVRRGGASPVGRPIPHLGVYLLDRAGRPVPLGVPGEIAVAGAGLARGYLDRPGLTAERFVPDPFAGEPGTRLYKSGDLARRRHDGDLVYLGRIDHQVKVRGHRVELGEVEAALVALPGVREAVAVARGDALVAYLVPADATPPADAELRRALRERLPEPLVPSAFVTLPAIPLTANGKVDRKALPEPTGPAAGLYAAPRTPVEEILCEIFAEVLGQERVGIDDDFFVLGGHSLLATQVAARVRQTLGLELPLRRLFEAKTVATLAPGLEPGRDLGGPVPVGRDRALPLSFAQERLWFLARLEPESTAYVLAFGVRFTGRLDTEALGAAIDEVVRRHESLRTVFALSGTVPVQVVRPAPSGVLRHAGLAGEGELARLVDDLTGPFDLEAGPLLRSTLARLGEEEHVAVLVMHHIVSDGWSMGVFVHELAALYRAFAAGRPSPLPEPGLQYADYAVWQRRQLTDDVLATQLDYWQEHLAGVAGVLELPLDRPRPAVESHRGASLPSLFARPELAALQALGRRFGTTLFMTLLAAFGALLGRVAGAPRPVVGTPVAGRGRRETEGLIGLFVNTLALRLDLAGDPSPEELLARTREITLDGYAHQDLPFERLVEALRVDRDLGSTPVFQVLLVLQNTPAAAFELPGVRLAPMPVEESEVKFDLTLAVQEGPDGLGLRWSYRRDLFDASTIRRLDRSFRTLATGLAGGQAARLSALPLLAAPERHQLLREWAPPKAAFRTESALHELFAEQAKRRGEATAVTCDGLGTSYAELDARSRRLARRLVALGVGPESRVGLAAERGTDLVVGILAVLRAGGAYVPLDPANPAARLAYLAEDARLEVLLTDAENRGVVPSYGGPTLLLGEDGDAEGVELPRLDPDRPAYVIYTSGSTGKPKGVVVTHRHVVRLLAATDAWFTFGPDDVWTLFHSFAFDFSVWELWGALAYGGRLVVVPYWVSRSPGDFCRLLAEQGVTVLNQTPSAFRQLIAAEAETDGAAAAKLRYVVFGGEALPVESLAPWIERHGDGTDRDGPALVNMYGITETTVHVTYRPVTARDVRRGGASPVGRPIPDLGVHLLDRAGRSVPLGVPGEIAVAGAGLARGYLDRPGLTAERFVPDPFAGEPGARLYKSGDLARHRADGDLVYLGRIDQQVKIRGFRVELGEVEAALTEHPAVREAVVLPRPPARLVAWVVTGGEAAPHDLRAFLQERLPEHMVPSDFVALPTLPLTPNGKVDRAALPEPERRAAEGRYVAPRTPVEEVLCEIFAEVLERDRVGVEDDFFELGGHSLLATRVAARVRATLGAELDLRRLFEAPTVAGLAPGLLASAGPADAIEPAPRESDLPLSFAQERLWFLHRLDPSSTAYVMPFAVRFTGRLDTKALGRAVDEIVRRHEVLRTVFASPRKGPVQVVQQPPADVLAHVEVAAGALPELIAGLSGPFDLGEGPLLRATLARLGEQEHVAVLVMHHVVADGWSMGVFVHELATLYRAFAAGEPSPLPELPVQVADFAVWQRRHLTEDVLAAHLDYWRGQLDGVSGNLDLPADRPRPAVETAAGGTVALTVPEPVLGTLKSLGRAHGTTLFMTLLAAFGAQLRRLTGEARPVVGTPVAGRGRQESEGLIGLFVNTLALRLDASGDPDVAEVLARVRAATLGGYAHQDLPFEKLVEALKPERDLGSTPFFQVMLVLHNTPLVALELPEVTLAPLPLEESAVKLDLTLAAQESPAGLELSWSYRRDLFDATTVRRLGLGFGVLLAGLEAGTPVSALPLLAPAERHQLLHELSPPRAAVRGDRPLHALFAEQVRRRGDAIATSDEERRLSYAELEERARRLAWRLVALGVGPEVRVGLCAERNVDLVAGVLGVLMAGGAYVPLDPALPQTRLLYLVEDARLEVLVVGREQRDLLPSAGATVLLLEDDGDDVPAAALPDVDPDHPAYVIYTSGSTGNPKGVVVTHRHVARLLAATDAWFTFGPDDVWTLFHSFAFDFSVWELWGALAYGGRLVVVPYWVSRSPEAFRRLLGEEGVTVLNQTPSAFRQLIRAEETTDGRAVARLRTVIFGGEALPADALAPWVERHGDGRTRGPKLVNMYGITETTVHVTYREVRAAETAAGGTSPIGVPIPDLGVYLLDKNGRAVPLGVPGEIAVAGDGLARGYLGRPALTAERFVPDPRGTAGARLYRSGDLARFRADGDLRYLGRIDHQVKIRGFRVELGEIESTLALHPAVREAVVLGRRDSRREDLALVAYFVAEGEAPAEGALRAFLKDRLPEHMVPSWFVPLSVLPLTANGKVDRQALPEPETPEPGPDFVGPRDALEIELTQLWEEVFERRPIGVRDTFFSLGGHSLLAAHLVTEMARRFHQELPLTAFFQEPTIEGLAAALRLKSVHSPIVALQREGDATPFFCVHPLLGDVLCYRHLANSLGRERPFLAIQSPGLLAGSAGDDVGEIAERYVEEMRSVQPVGPYLLGGWSFGGAVAFEMACRLREGGESVAFLAMLDSGPNDFGKPETEEGVELDEADLALFFFEGLIPLPMDDLKEELSTIAAADRLTHIVKHWRKRRFVPHDFSVAAVRAYLTTTEAHLRAALSWQARPYPGRLDLFSVRGEGDDSDPTLGWGALAADVHVHEVEGSHGQLVFPPHVQNLAQRIREQIEWKLS